MRVFPVNLHFSGGHHPQQKPPRIRLRSARLGKRAPQRQLEPLDQLRAALQKRAAQQAKAEALAKEQKMAALKQTAEQLSRSAVLPQVFVTYQQARVTGADILERIAYFDDMFRGKTDPPTARWIMKDTQLDQFSGAFSQALQALEKKKLIRVWHHEYEQKRVYSAIAQNFAEVCDNIYITLTPNAQQALTLYKKRRK